MEQWVGEHCLVRNCFCRKTELLYFLWDKGHNGCSSNYTVWKQIQTKVTEHVHYCLSPMNTNGFFETYLNIIVTKTSIILCIKVVLGIIKSSSFSSLFEFLEHQPHCLAQSYRTHLPAGSCFQKRINE